MWKAVMADKRSVVVSVYLAVLVVMPLELRTTMFTILITAVLAGVWLTGDTARGFLQNDRDGRDATIAAAADAGTALLVPSYLGVSWHAVHASLLALGTGLYLLPWPNTSSHTHVHTLAASVFVIAAGVYIYTCAFAAGMEYGRYTAKLPAEQAMDALDLPIKTLVKQRLLLGNGGAESTVRPGAVTDDGSTHADASLAEQAPAASAAVEASYYQASKQANTAMASSSATATAAAAAPVKLPLTPVSASIIADARAHAQSRLLLDAATAAGAGAGEEESARAAAKGGATCGGISGSPAREKTSSRNSGVSPPRGVGSERTDGTVAAKKNTQDNVRPMSWGPAHAAAVCSDERKDTGKQRESLAAMRASGSSSESGSGGLTVKSGSGKNLLAPYFHKLSIGGDLVDGTDGTGVNEFGGNADAGGNGEAVERGDNIIDHTVSGSSGSGRNRVHTSPAVLTMPAIEEKEERGVVDRTTDAARQTLFALLGFEGVASAYAGLYSSIKWDLQHHHNDDAGQASIWASHSNTRGPQSCKDFGIVLRGNCYCRQPAAQVAQW